MRCWRYPSVNYDEDDELPSDIDEHDEGNTTFANTVPEECKMVLGVRMDLKMDKGKIAAQCGHATLAAYRVALRTSPEYVRAWQKLGCVHRPSSLLRLTKIAIKIPDEQQMLQVKDHARKLNVPAYVIQDAYVHMTNKQGSHASGSWEQDGNWYWPRADFRDRSTHTYI